MGRLVAYIGPETNIASAVEGGSYSLVRQAEECHDGFAVAWYPLDDAAEPVRIRSRSSIRADGHLLEVPRRYASRTVVAGVRQLPSGVASELAGVQPLQYGPYLFAQEGTLERFDEVFARPLLASLSDEHFASLKGRSPGEVLFACWLDGLNGTGPDAMATALEAVVGRVQEIATEKDVPASLALAATDGTCLLAVRTATHGPPPPLYTTVADDRAPVPPSGRLVASEPTFPGSWQSIDAHALMIFTVESGAEAPTEAIEAPM